MKIGDKIRNLRIKYGYTLEELAEAANTTKQTIHKYETGIITNIPASKIKALADKLETTPAYLMGWGTETEEVKDTLCLSEHHKRVIKAYIAQPQMQPAVDRLLGIATEDTEDNISCLKEEKVIPFIAAESGKEYKAKPLDLETMIEIEKMK